MMRSTLWLPDVRCRFSVYDWALIGLLVYRPNLRPKSDADILRDAKLEAMGLPPQDDSPRRTNHDRHQTATDEIVCVVYGSLGYSDVHLLLLLGHGALQETNAQVIRQLQVHFSFFIEYSTVLCHDY